MPLVLVGRRRDDDQRDHAAVLVAVGDRSGVQEAVKRVLALGAGPVGNLNSRAALVGVLKEVDVRALVETVMWRVVGFGAVKVVDVSEAIKSR